MKKLIALGLLCLVWLASAPAMAQTASVICLQSTNIFGVPSCISISATNPFPIAVYDAGNHSGYVYTSNGSASPATFQPSSGGGGGAVAISATTSNITEFPIFALAATATATTIYIDTASPLTYNPSTKVLSTATLTAATLNFTNALGTTATIGTLNVTTCNGCSAAPGGSGLNVQYRATSSTFGGANGLYVSTTRGGLDFLSAVTTANFLSQGANGTDTTSFAVGGSALLVQTATGANNIAIGTSSLAALTTGINNTAVGSQAGNAIVTDQAGTFIGFQAGKVQNIGNSTTGGNTAVGYQSLVAVTTQIGDTAVGYQSGRGATTGNGLNSFFGWSTGTDITTGTNNTIIGAKAIGGGNTTGNTIIGEAATGSGASSSVVVGTGASGNSQANNSTVVGFGAKGGAGFGDSSTVYGFSANGGGGSSTVMGLLAGSGNGGSTSGTNNVFIGNRVAQATGYNTSNNTVVGATALNTVTTGGSNTVFGYNGGALITTGTGNTLVGASVATGVLTIGSNNIIIGNSLDTTTSSTSNTANIGGVWTVTGTNTASTAIHTLSGSVLLPNIASDSGVTDATMCEDTTNHKIFAGSGTLGICLGTSSARYKNHIVQLAPELAKIMALKPVTFNFKDKSHGDPAKKYYGFIAEDAANVFPDLVGIDNQGRPNTFDYLGLVAPMIKAIQEQQAEINALKKQLAKRK